MTLFRHRADIPAVLYVLAVFALQLTVFFTVDDLWLAAGCAFVLMLAQVSCGAICHNHHHVNIFTRRPLNRFRCGEVTRRRVKWLNRCLPTSLRLISWQLPNRSWIDRGTTMKKQTRGFWTWLLGGGWSQTGTSG